MAPLVAVALCALITSVRGTNLTFPAGFIFGAGTASYQIEGGWNADGKGENIWDRYTHAHSDKILDAANGDVASDSYHRWRDDVQAAVDMKLDFYRFSISWNRILPDGFAHKISEDGTRYYDELIDEIVSHGIEPMVTIFHWDLPQQLQDLGGWANPKIVDWYGHYARIVFRLYGDRVKTWFTINEGSSICDVAYNAGLFAPGIVDVDRGMYLCTKHVLLAHAKAWRIYDEEFRATQKGKISIVNHFLWVEPESSSPEDEHTAELARQYLVGRFNHAIFSKEGGWPPVLEQIVAANSKREGYPESRLPAFTQKEKDFVKGTYDFIGMNYYTARMSQLKRNNSINIAPNIYEGGIPELNISLELNRDIIPTAYTLLPSYPVGIRRQLAWFKQQYGDVEVLLTENGYPGSGRPEDDALSIAYLKDHLEQVLLSIYQDGVRVVGFTFWSLIDIFEWANGYRPKFGLYKVDFDDPLRPRSPRLVSHYYAKVIKNHAVMPE